MPAERVRDEIFYIDDPSESLPLRDQVDLWVDVDDEEDELLLAPEPEDT